MVHTKITKARGDWSGGERGVLFLRLGGRPAGGGLPAAPEATRPLCGFVLSLCESNSSGWDGEAVGVLAEDFEAVFAAGEYRGHLRDDDVELGGEGGEIGGGVGVEEGVVAILASSCPAESRTAWAWLKRARARSQIVTAHFSSSRRKPGSQREGLGAGLP